MKKITEEKINSNFLKLIKKEELDPETFFQTRWSTFEEIPLFSYFSRVSFLDNLQPLERDLHVLKFALDYLGVLVAYACKRESKEAIKNMLLYVTIQNWDLHPEDPIQPSFFITYRCHDLFEPAKPFAKSHTEQSKYIINILEKLGITENYFVCDDRPSYNCELQRVRIGLKKHPSSDLITLDQFVKTP